MNIVIEFDQHFPLIFGRDSICYLKAVDRDNSGYITVGELGMLGGGKMDEAKTTALMAKLDTDKDGRISLSEFKKLFKQ